MRLRRLIVLLFCIFLIFILQCDWVQALSLGGVIPNVILILVVSVAFFRGCTVGLLTGFLCGLLQDLLFGDVLGFYAMVYMCAGYFSGLAHKEFYDYDLKLPLTLIAAADLFYSFIVYGFLFLIRGRLNFTYYLTRVILPEAVYTVLAAVAVYSVLYLINYGLLYLERRRDSYFV